MNNEEETGQELPRVHVSSYRHYSVPGKCSIRCFFWFLWDSDGMEVSFLSNTEDSTDMVRYLRELATKQEIFQIEILSSSRIGAIDSIYKFTIIIYTFVSS